MQKVTNSLAHTVSQLKLNQNNKDDGILSEKLSGTTEKKDLDKSGAENKSVKQQLNRAILQANINVSVDVGNEPLALLFKTAIEGINEILEGEGLGSNAIQDAYESELDITPKVTADRIVAMSTAFFSQYQRQHPEMAADATIASFTDIIREGIDKGFAEAKEILDGLEVLEGDIAINIDLTYDMVQQGLRDFVAGFGAIEEEVD